VSERVCLDASAVLAFLFAEPGAGVVTAHLADAALSTVNYCEALEIARARGLDVEWLREDLQALGVELHDFTPEDADHAAAMREAGRKAGLSFGDRACLALGERLGAPVLTADRTWARLEGIRVKVKLIRP
jgi:ribonuclease VapC